MPTHDPRTSQVDICTVVCRMVIEGRETGAAIDFLRRCQDIERHLDTLCPSRRNTFFRQCRQHLSIYLPKCKFEIIEMPSYKTGKCEMGVRARRKIVGGELIEFLEGFAVYAGREGSRDQAATYQLSCLESDRFPGPWVLLSSARFVNHACAPNSTLVRDSRARVRVKAIQDIEAGQEITVNYGAAYFGDDNEGCWCLSCRDGDEQHGDIQCAICKWKYIRSPTRRGCPWCCRHFFLYRQHWPLTGFKSR